MLKERIVCSESAKTKIEVDPLSQKIAVLVQYHEWGNHFPEQHYWTRSKDTSKRQLVVIHWPRINSKGSEFAFINGCQFQKSGGLHTAYGHIEDSAFQHELQQLFHHLHEWHPNRSVMVWDARRKIALFAKRVRNFPSRAQIGKVLCFDGKRCNFRGTNGQNFGKWFSIFGRT